MLRGRRWLIDKRGLRSRLWPKTAQVRLAMVALREWAEAPRDGSRPDTFQRDTDAPGEFLQHGFIDMIVDRRKMKDEISRLLTYLAPVPA